MRQTIFIIENWLFADRWILIGWLLLGLVYAAALWWRGQRNELWYWLTLFAIGGAIIEWVLPAVQIQAVNPADPNGPLIPAGLAIRGYGVCLLMGMLAAFGLALSRSQQVGEDSEKILSLGIWMIVCGLVGARLFFVIQKRDHFGGLPLRELIFRLVDMTSGGLVVYGSLIGAMVALVVYTKWQGMNWRRAADIMAPALLIGVAIGRLGCLMNGCCFGGPCGEELPGIYFPAASPPYVQQLSRGELFGIIGQYDETTNEITVADVLAGSEAEKLGIGGGDRLRIFLSHPQRDDSLTRLAAVKRGVSNDLQVILDREGKRPILLPASSLPDVSLRTHPTQLYSALHAALLCAVLWFYFPYRPNDGSVFALLMITYPIGRFVLELIRQDESGQFGTSLTISQWFSLILFGVGVVAFGYLFVSRPRSPKGGQG
jgi:phosphatidylglycerol:prolipoprotein diacylglycerol transferase